MSWYGTHPRYSKEQIKALLPAAACKQCVYWFRAVIGLSPETWHQEHPLCPRCGIPQWRLLAELNERLLGIVNTATSRAQEADEAAAAISPRPIHRRRAAECETTLNKWLGLYASQNPEISIRAARALLDRSDAPLSVILDILDTLSWFGLGARTEKVLLGRKDPELFHAMLVRLDSSNEFILEVACRVLGQFNDRRATPRLLAMIDDRRKMVRRAAGFALAELKDPAAIPELKRQLARRRDDDINVVWALQTALQSLGVRGDDG